MLTEPPAAVSPSALPDDALEDALCAANAAAWEWETETGAIRWSRHAHKLLDAQPGTLPAVLAEWLEFISEDDRSRVREVMEAARRSGVPFDIEWRLHRSDHHHPCWILCRGQSGPVQPGSHAAIYRGVLLDITARKRAELETARLTESLDQTIIERTAQLTEHERLLQHILDGIPGPVGYWTKDLVNRFANQAYASWFGRQPEEVRHMRLQELIGEEIFKRSWPRIQQALQGQAQAYEAEMAPNEPHGEPRHVSVQYVPDVVDGVVQGYLVIMLDITAIKRAELAAEAASQAKSEFVANISHELRTPLNAMFGLAQVGMKQAGSPTAAKAFEQILESAQHLLTLVNDVLDFSKVDAGKLRLHTERINIPQIIEQVMALHAIRAQGKGLRLTLHESANVPRQCHADARRLSQILLNLMSNAIRFTDQGSVDLSVDYRAPELIFAVSDTGIGMSADKVSALFQPFVQVHQDPATESGGTGLGLAITKRLVDLFGGTIHVTSEPGRGSTFTVRVPVSQAEVGDFAALCELVLIGLPAQECQALASLLRARGCHVHESTTLPALSEPVKSILMSAEVFEQTPLEALRAQLDAGRNLLVHTTAGMAVNVQQELQGGIATLAGPLSPLRLVNAIETRPGRLRTPTGQRLKGIRVLAAEDNPVNRLVLGQMLEQEGAKVVFAFDGAHALEQVRIHGPASFDIVLCDIQMPVMDGYEATQALSRIAPTLPVVGLTAHAFDSAKQQARKVGMVGYVTKPYMLDTLVEEIRRYARRHAGDATAPEDRTQPETMMTSTPAQQDITDWQAMQQYFRAQPQLLDRLIGMLGDTLAGIHRELMQTINARDLPALAKVAHNIKGTALNLHTPELARLAVQTQEQARQQSEDEALQTAETLSSRLRDFIHMAAQHQQQGASHQVDDSIDQ